MANEQQYYNPIIEAMIATTNHNEKIKTREQQGKQHEAELKQREKEQQDRHKEFELQLKQNADFHNKQLDLQNEAHKLQAAQTTGQLFKLGRDISKEGGDWKTFRDRFPNLLGGIQGPQEQANLGDVPQINRQTGQEIQMPVMGQQEGNPFYSAETEAVNLQKIAEAEGSVKDKFAAKNDERDFANKKRFAEFENVFKANQSQLDRDLHERIANAANATHLKVAGMTTGKNAITDSALKGMIVGSMTGDIDLDGSNPIEKAALGSIYEMGGKPIGKKEIEALKQSQALAPIFDKLDKFAEKLPTSKPGAVLQGAYLSAARQTPFTPDLQNEINILKSQALNIGKALEGMTGGRVLLSQMQLDLDSFAAGNITKKQMQDRIQNLRDFYINKVDEMYLAGTTGTQRQLLQQRKGIIPAYVTLAPKTNKAGHTLDEEASIRMGRPVYGGQ